MHKKLHEFSMTQKGTYGFPVEDYADADYLNFLHEEGIDPETDDYIENSKDKE